MSGPEEFLPGEPSAETNLILTATYGFTTSNTDEEALLFARTIRETIESLTPEQTYEVITSLALTAVVDMVETANAHGIKPDDYIAQFAAPLTHE